MLTPYRYPNTASWLNQVLAEPDLAARIPALSDAALQELIGEVGLEDASELVALATDQQLSALLDAQLWRSSTSPLDTFDADRFVFWLQVLREAGEAVLGRALLQLDADVLALAVHRHILVINMDRLQTSLAQSPEAAAQVEQSLGGLFYEEWEEFALVARSLDSWEVVWDGLLWLNRDHYDTLRALLERCAWLAFDEAQEEDLHAEFGEQDTEEGPALGLGSLLSQAQLVESRALQARDDRRTQAGHVTRADALAFVRLAAHGLVPEDTRDAITAAYFRQVTPRSTTPAPQENTPLHAQVQSLVPGAAPLSNMGTWLTHLQGTHPQQHGQRLDELAYLANVLLALSDARPITALKAASAICEWALLSQERAPVTVLASTSADRLFRCALKTLQSLGTERWPSAVQPFIAQLHNPT